MTWFFISKKILSFFACLLFLLSTIDSHNICPGCHSELSETEDFTLWCKKCEWNLVPSESVKSGSVFQNIYLSLSRKYSESLFNSLVNSSTEKLKPTITLALVFAFSVSAIIYLITIFLAIFGVWILVIGWANIFALIIGTVCLLISWFIRPRIPKVPKGVVTRKDFPILYEFIDSIALSLNSKSVDGVIIKGDLNASFGQFGLTNKKIIRIGLPLWEILSIEEKSALISHELSHGINGDPLRGLFIGKALESLIGWYFLLRPDSFWEPENGLLGILMLPLNVVLFAISGLVLLIARLLAHLIYIDSQKSEYFADYLATKVCGTDAMASLLEKSLIGSQRFELILHKVSLRKEEGDLFEDFSKDVLSLSTEEKVKIRKIGESAQSRLDATHPPTFFRIRFLKHHFEAGTKIQLSADKVKLLELEMSKMKSSAQAEIIDIYKSSLYY